MKLPIKLGVAALALAMLTGCATTRSPDSRDPIEPVNRAVYEFNDGLDRAVLKPVAQGYRAVLPSPVRTGVRNFFANLRDPWIAVNQLLQGKVNDALSDTWRFIANTTFGIGGVFDIASDMGMPKHQEDFGQTLGVWGLEPGPYLVLPFFGPSSARDGTGLVADIFVGYAPIDIPRWLDLEHRVTWRNALIALDVINIRSNLLDATNVLEEAALDRYAFLRDAYFQRRLSQVYDGNPPPMKSSGVGDSLETESARFPVASAAQEPKSGAGVEPFVPTNYEAVLAVDAR